MLKTILSLGLLFAALELDARGLVVSPAQVGVVGLPGATVSAVITVGSSRAEENQVQVSFVAFDRSEDAKTILLPSDTNPRSCRHWLSVPQSMFISPAAGRVEVPVTVKIPAGASGSYWAAAVLKASPVTRFAEAQKPSVRIIPQIAVPIIVTVQGTEKAKIQIVSLDVHPAAGALTSYAVAENTGNTAVMVGGAFALERKIADSDETEELAAVDVGPTLCLPGHRTRLRGDIKWTASIDAAQIRALLRFGPGADDVVEAVSVPEARVGEPTAQPKGPNG